MNLHYSFTARESIGTNKHTSHRVVLKSDWISTCLGRGAMLGPKANPPWGGLRLKYYPSAQEFFDDEPEEITKEAMLSFPVVRL